MPHRMRKGEEGTHDEAIYLSDRLLLLSGRPASFQQEIVISECNRNREWLFGQADLHSEIYHWLKRVRGRKLSIKR